MSRTTARRPLRAVLLSAAAAGSFVLFAAPAVAAESGPAVRGAVHAGNAPVNTCTTEFVEEYKYPNEGYRVHASARASPTGPRDVASRPTRFLPGESDPLTLTVYRAGITVESTTLQPGEDLWATATLPAGATGRVQFLMRGGILMGGIGSADVVDGRAELFKAVDSIGAGTFGLAADYRGGGGFTASRSEPVTVTIGAASSATGADAGEPADLAAQQG